MHKWKQGDKAMVEVEIDQIGLGGSIRINNCWYHESKFRPITPDWREKWEERTIGGHEVLFAAQDDNGEWSALARAGKEVWFITQRNLIPKRPPAPPEPEKKWRPWKQEEVPLGKVVRKKSNHKARVLLCSSEQWSGPLTLENWELEETGEPCGVFE